MAQVSSRVIVQSERRPNFDSSSVASGGVKLAPELRPVLEIEGSLVGVTQNGDAVIDVPALGGSVGSAISKLNNNRTRARQVDTSHPVVPLTELIVFWTEKEFPADNTLHGLTIKERYAPGGFLVLSKTEGGFTASDLRSLVADKRVRYVEPSFPRYIQEAKQPNENVYANGDLWGLKNIRSEGLWSKQTHSDLIVAVIDTGVDLTHPDLKDNLLPSGHNFLNPSLSPTDDNGHGTHVAGIIGAKGNNNAGVVGVAWTVRLLPLKIFPSSGRRSGPAFDVDAVKAIDYAISAGAKIINNSWSSQSFSVAVKEAVSRTEKADVIFVAAAANDQGNDNDKAPRFPASYSNPNIISVHSIDPDDGLSVFSNYGRLSVHIGAPGNSILSTDLAGTYQSRSGTSQATPFVSGALAVLWSLPENKSKSALQIKSLLLNNARNVPALLGLSETGRALDLGFVLDANISDAASAAQSLEGYVVVDGSRPHSVTINGRSVSGSTNQDLFNVLELLNGERVTVRGKPF